MKTNILQELADILEDAIVYVPLTIKGTVWQCRLANSFMRIWHYEGFLKPMRPENVRPSGCGETKQEARKQLLSVLDRHTVRNQKSDSPIEWIEIYVEVTAER